MTEHAVEVAASLIRPKEPIEEVPNYQFNVWIRVRGNLPPQAYQSLILHTPQYAETLGEGVTGVWTGEEWQADDDRDLVDYPPVHFLLIGFPDFKGEAEDYPPVEFESDEELLVDEDDEADMGVDDDPLSGD
ncbi:hypothetical protein EVB27_039 [Rhizobium phage RHph_TM16]|nr:hypothetical protein EVB27_039 [Rhizobium phage RHph_TM16]